MRDEASSSLRHFSTFYFTAMVTWTRLAGDAQHHRVRWQCIRRSERAHFAITGLASLA